MGTSGEHAVQLPSSEVEFCNRVSSFSNSSSLAATNPEDLPPALQKVIKYSGSALKSGYPFHKVMIVVSGASGVGKSSTIKALFNDDGCFAGIENSETREVTEYSKELCVTSEVPPVKGTLSFVDMPGNLHADAFTQVDNLSVIAKFREDHPDLQSRSSLPDIEKMCSLTVKEKVYPNTVLFTVVATDNRMVGPDSNLRKSLWALKENHFVDENCSNLIVVVTHAMSLPVKTYIAKSKDITRNIRDAVYEVFQVHDSKVVFVENRPEAYDMAKATGSDFYELPDKQLSHYNLFQEMANQFQANNDFLGSLLCGWYFSDNCPEKKNKVTRSWGVNHSTLGETDMTKSQHFLSSINMSSSLEESITTYQFQNLGRGYCPRTETLRNVVVYRPTESHTRKIYGKPYAFPNMVNVICTEEDYSYLKTQETKTEYEKKKIVSYDLSIDDCLDVHIDSTGRWVKNSSGQHNSEVTFVYEKRVIQAQLEHAFVVKEELLDAITQLPEYYEENNCHSFNEFFSKWGSHFIHEEWIGGAIQVESDVNGSRYTATEGSEILKDLTEYFEFVTTSDTTAVSIVDQMIEVCGGNISGLNTLSNVTPQRFAEWVESVKVNPTELNSFKLYPYYNLVESRQRESLKQATTDYLAGSYLEKLKTRKLQYGPRRKDASMRVVSQALAAKPFNCFPPFAKVSSTRGLTCIDTITSGDEVLTVNITRDFQQSQVEMTRVCTFLHYDPERTAEFFVLHLENGQRLTITGEHLVYHYEEDVLQTTRAKKVQIGHKLLSVNKEKQLKLVIVSGITTTIVKGVYSPLTNAGTLIVDGIFVSCYANVDSHSLAHGSMVPLRMWYKLCNALATSISSMQMKLPMLYLRNEPNKLKQKSEIHKYAQFLMLLCSWLPFEVMKQ